MKTEWTVFMKAWKAAGLDSRIFESLRIFASIIQDFQNVLKKIGLEQQTKMLKASIILIYNSAGLPSVRNSVKKAWEAT